VDCLSNVHFARWRSVRPDGEEITRSAQLSTGLSSRETVTPAGDETDLRQLRSHDAFGVGVTGLAEGGDRLSRGGFGFGSPP
jgi:hypothetical protein